VRRAYNESMDSPFFLRLAYLGSTFHGWQIQKTETTVQGILWGALRVMEPRAPLPQGTGRTDAGVHALAQGVLVRLSRPWIPYRLLAALNAHLPPEIRVLSVEVAPEGFFPRQHAVAKRYVYRLQEGPSEDPFQHNRCWHIHGAETLDKNAMQQGAQHLIGTHDFSSFRHQECSAKTPVRSLYSVRLEISGSKLDIVYEGNRFLMHQVRIMTGTLVDIGKGRINAQNLPSILLARERRLAGHTAPPYGLYLEQVWYQSRWGLGEVCPWGEEEPQKPGQIVGS
jgi:tRNA pseudouridine38-40 synthase